GNAYVTGTTGANVNSQFSGSALPSKDFPTTEGAFQATCPGTCTTDSAWVTKLNASGSALVYSTYLGGSGNTDSGIFGSIGLDSSLNAYVTGFTAATDFPTKNPIQAANAGGAFDAYVTELNPSGSGTPTGTVTFKDGTTKLGTVALSGGVAKFSTTTLSVATHSITAVYSGDPTFLTSTSAVLSQVVNSSGGGGAVTFTPTSLSFTQQLVGAKSAAKPVTLKNSGTGALTISSIVAVGNFSETNNCPASLAAGLTCTISVSFTPSITGKVLGEVTVTDNAPGTTQEIGLFGNGVTPLNFSPTSLSFGAVTVGTTTAAKIVTVINNSTTSLTMSWAW